MASDEIGGFTCGNGGPRDTASGDGFAVENSGSNLSATVTSTAPMYAAIEKLEGNGNYLTWKFAMRMILTLEGLWECVLAESVDAARDQRALARIALSIKPSLYQYIRNATSAKQAWNSLAEIYQDKGLLRRVLLLRELHSARFNDFMNMNKYIEHIMSIVQQLADIGRVIDDQEVAELLLSGLPQEYDPLVSTLSTYAMTSTLSSEIVRTRLLHEDLRKTKSSTANVGTSEAALLSKKKIICHYCHKEGHVKAKCYKLKRDKKTNFKNNNGDKCMAAAFFTRQEDWFIDSGCTAHMCKDKNNFVSIQKTTSSSVSIANNDKIKCEGIGLVRLETNTKVLALYNVLYVPQLSANLLSVSKLVEIGLRVVFNMGGCYIYDNDDKLIGTANNINGIFKLNGNVRGDRSVLHNGVCSVSLHNRQESQSAAVAAQQPSILLWHQRLGHLSSGGMYSLGDRYGNGCVLQVKDKFPDCVACLEGKLAAKPFPKGPANRATSILELVHSDVCGPMPVSSWGGANYILTFTDDYSRKSFVYLMRNKSEVCDHFINFKNFVEKQTGLSIKCLRTDNGTEYVNRKLTGFLNKEGILHQLTVPYCPQQNAVSERLNRTLMDKVRCMLQHSRLDQRFWGEAVMTAVYLKNRSPTSALDGRIPEEVWTGSKIELGHLRVFGCRAYALVPGVKRSKLDAKCKVYIFVGYSETTKGYRLADPSCPSKVLLSRDVTFMEEQFFNFGLSNDNNNNVNNDEIILLNDNLCNDVSNSNKIINNNECVETSHSNLNESVMTNDKNVSCVSTDQWSTGSEREHDSSVECSADEADLQSVTSSCAASAGGEGLCESSRPVRSTRSIPPKRYGDYDLSMLAMELLVNEPQSYNEAINSSQRDEWMTAMQREYNSLVENKVWRLVERPKNHNVVKCKWVFKAKCDASGNFQQYKARLVARGFTQKEGVDYYDTFSPVVRHSTMRLLFSIANEYDLEIDHIDVNTAFLNGDLNETIYMEQPEGFCKNNDKVCLLQRSIYGLKQASRMWYCKVNELLTKHNFVQSKSEPCVYYLKTDKDIVIIALYVDDFYVFYNKGSSCITVLLNLLEQEFSIKNLGPVQNYLGIRVTRDRVKGTLTLDQSVYIKNVLKKFGMSDCKPVSTPMQSGFKLCKTDDVICDNVYNYRQLLGCLMYLSVCTRPDIAYTCSQLSQYNNCFGKCHWTAAKRVLRYLSGTIDYGLLFVKSNQLLLSAYADADWANDCIDRKSYTGFAIKLGNNIVNWESRKQKCVALSSTEAEYLAISDVCKDLCFISNFLSEIFNQLTLNCITLFNDNQSAHRLLESKEYCHKRTKHIDIRYHYVKDLVNSNFVNVKYLCTDKMVADVMTKPLDRRKHNLFMYDLCVRHL